MATSTSILCKEIRDSAEQAVGLADKLKKVSLNTEWNIFLGTWSNWNEKNESEVVRDWQSALRELEGHFIAIRDQCFAIVQSIQFGAHN